MLRVERFRGSLLRGMTATTVIVFCVALCAAACSSSQNTQVQAQKVACDQVENLTPGQLERFFQAAKGALEKEGVKLDAQVWGDPDRFQRYVTAVSNAAGCPTAGGPSASTPGTTSSPLHSNEITDYCGPGHGLLAVHVSDCLNRACLEHDSCYARCSAPTDTNPLDGCAWSAPTHPCDDVLLATADACDNSGARFRSWVVRRLAHALYDAGGFDHGCLLSMRCPGPNARGYGPCAIDATGETCKACRMANADSLCEERVLNARDPAHEPCAKDGSDYICVTADCPRVAKCFGPPAAATPDAGAGDAGDAGPANDLEIPPTGGKCPATHLLVPQDGLCHKICAAGAGGVVICGSARCTLKCGTTQPVCVTNSTLCP